MVFVIDIQRLLTVWMSSSTSLKPSFWSATANDGWPLAVVAFVVWTVALALLAAVAVTPAAAEKLGDPDFSFLNQTWGGRTGWAPWRRPEETVSIDEWERKALKPKDPTPALDVWSNMTETKRVSAARPG